MSAVYCINYIRIVSMCDAIALTVLITMRSASEGINRIGAIHKIGCAETKKPLFVSGPVRPEFARIRRPLP